MVEYGDVDPGRAQRIPLSSDSGTVQTNSQPADGMDRLHGVVMATYQAVKPPASP